VVDAAQISYGCRIGIITLDGFVTNVHDIDQKNVNQSGSHRQTSQTHPLTSTVLLCHPRCSQAALELSKVVTDSGIAFSGAPESTWSDQGAFRML